MEVFVLSFIVFGLAALGMAAGLVLRGTELKGTCATLSSGVHAALGCEFCPTRHSQGICRQPACAHFDYPDGDAGGVANRTTNS